MQENKFFSGYRKSCGSPEKHGESDSCNTPITAKKLEHGIKPVVAVSSNKFHSSDPRVTFCKPVILPSFTFNMDEYDIHALKDTGYQANFILKFVANKLNLKVLLDNI